MSKIEWTEETWNPLIGCSKVSPGCKNCYAIQTAWIRQHNPKMSERYAGVVEKTPAGNLNWTGKVNVANEAIDKPLRKKKPTKYFVNSMSDLFHEAVPFEVIDKIYAIMGRCQHHVFQILTKRPERMLEYYKSDPYQRILSHAYALNLSKGHSLGAGIDNPNTPGAWGWEHVWLGVSVENQQTANERIPLLLQVPAAVRFLSCEPLLGPLRLDQLIREEEHYAWVDNCLTGFKAHGAGGWYDNKIDWVIVGGESGAGARPLHPDWVRSLRDQCQKTGTRYFFKQWGEYYTHSYLSGSGQPHFRMFTNMQHWVDKAQTWVRGGRCISIDGRKCKSGKDFKECAYPVVIMDKVGKKKAGRLLDGREWNEFPGKQTVSTDDPDLFFSGPDY
jgi:protein gp37